MEFVYKGVAVGANGKRRRVVDEGIELDDFDIQAQERLLNLENSIGNEIPELNKTLLRAAWDALYKRLGITPYQVMPQEEDETFRILLEISLAKLAIVSPKEFIGNQKTVQQSILDVGMAVILDAVDERNALWTMNGVEKLYDSITRRGVEIDTSRENVASKLIHDENLGQLLRPPHDPPLKTFIQGEEVLFSNNITIPNLAIPFFSRNIDLADFLLETADDGEPATKVRLVSAFATKEFGNNDNIYPYEFNQDVLRATLIVSQSPDAAIGFTAGSQGIDFSSKIKTTLLSCFAISSDQKMMVLYSNGTKYNKYAYKDNLDGDIWMAGEPQQFVSYKKERVMMRLDFSFQNHNLSRGALERIVIMMENGFVLDVFDREGIPQFIQDNIDFLYIYEGFLNYVPSSESKKRFFNAVQQKETKLTKAFVKKLLGFRFDQEVVVSDLKGNYKQLKDQIKAYNVLIKDDKSYASGEFEPFLEGLVVFKRALRDIVKGVYDPETVIPLLLRPLPKLPIDSNPNIVEIYSIVKRVQGAWRQLERLNFYDSITNFLDVAFNAWHYLRVVLRLERSDEKTIQPVDLENNDLIERFLQRRRIQPVIAPTGEIELFILDSQGFGTIVTDNRSLLEKALEMVQFDFMQFNQPLLGKTFDSKYDAINQDLLTVLEVLDLESAPAEIYQEFRVVAVRELTREDERERAGPSSSGRRRSRRG